jgi:hypothetical protein
MRSFANKAKAVIGMYGRFRIPLRRAARQENVLARSPAIVRLVKLGLKAKAK